MTRKEKEKILLDGLGLKIGDVVEIRDSVSMICNFKIEEEKKCYSLYSEGFYLNITTLINCDFQKLSPKKRKGELKCNGVSMDNGCKNCPLRTLFRCGCSSKTETVNDCLESVKEDLDPRVYEAYKNALNEEVEEE